MPILNSSMYFLLLLPLPLPLSPGKSSINGSGGGALSCGVTTGMFMLVVSVLVGVVVCCLVSINDGMLLIVGTCGIFALLLKLNISEGTPISGLVFVFVLVFVGVVVVVLVGAKLKASAGALLNNVGTSVIEGTTILNRDDLLAILLPLASSFCNMSPAFS